jgi:hypothetical protein
MKQSSWHVLYCKAITREDEHRALLALTQQLPDLREVDFEVNGLWWERRRDNTWTQKYVFSLWRSRSRD